MTEPASTLGPAADESLDRLSRMRRVLQRRRGHRSATDDLVAAWVAGRSRPEARRVLDLGCGHGTVTLHLSELLLGAEFVLVEVNPVSADLARRNMQLNDLSDRVTVIEEDLRSLADNPSLLGEGGFDLITGTPPFMPLGSGPLSSDPQRRAARFEINGGIEDYCSASARFLAEGGCVSMVMDAAQDSRVRRSFEAAELAIEKVVVVIPRQGKRPRYRAYLGTTADVGTFGAGAEEQLVVRTEEGAFTGQMLALRRELGLLPVEQGP